MASILDLERAKAALAASPTVAVVGAHVDPSRPAHYVPAYLLAHGYRILPVNPVFAGQTLFGQVVRASLTELDEPVHLVDVFRRSADVAGHVEEVLAMVPLPRVVWLQLGIRNDAAAARWVEAGIDVVQDRCTLADHQRYGLGRPTAP